VNAPKLQSCIQSRRDAYAICMWLIQGYWDNVAFDIERDDIAA
jgi:hypothetical protein